MSDLDLAVLRQVADAATLGPWEAEYNDEEGEILVNAGSARTVWHEDGDGGRYGIPASSWRTTDRIIERDDMWDADFDQAAADAEFIATFDPPTVKALLKRLEAAEARLVVDDAMVERAAAAYQETWALVAPKYGSAIKTSEEFFQVCARAALTAALGGDE